MNSEMQKFLANQESIDIVCILRSGVHALDSLRTDLNKNKINAPNVLVYFNPHIKPHTLQRESDNTVAIITDDQIGTGRRMRQTIETCLSAGYQSENLVLYVRPNVYFGQKEYWVCFDTVADFLDKYPEIIPPEDVNVTAILAELSRP
jgi:hypothetical protein